MRFAGSSATTSPTIIRLSRCRASSRDSSTSEALRFRLVAENSHRLLSRRQRTQGGGRGLSTPRQQSVSLSTTAVTLKEEEHTPQIAFHLALSTGIAGLVPTTVLGGLGQRRSGRRRSALGVDGRFPLALTGGHDAKKKRRHQRRMRANGGGEIRWEMDRRG